MRKFFVVFLHLGMFGPLILGILDSSFLFLPFGNDLLLVILIARNHHHFALYVPMAALGSTIGVYFLDMVCRKGGEEGLERMMDEKRFAYFEKKMRQRAGPAVALACIVPPPFPFTAVIAAASAFQYPRGRLLTIAFVMRSIRFSIVGVLAIVLGRQILDVVKSSVFHWVMVGFIALCVVGSTISVIGWIRRTHTPRTSQKQPARLKRPA